MDVLDLTGKPCPIPVIETKKALRNLEPGRSLAVLVDNDIARQNLQKMAAGLGHGFAFAPEGDNLKVTVTVGAGCRLDDGAEDGGLVVAVGREVMGGGSDELGRSLMKSFIYSLTELEPAPERLLLFNGGVKLAVEGSAALDDLRALAGRGTVINSCGACLNYYELTEKVQVGGVTNMYAILGTMAQARKLINL